MKRLIGLVLLLLFVGFCSNAFATAGSVTQAGPVAVMDPQQPFKAMGPDVKYKVTITWTDSDTPGAVPTATINGTATTDKKLWGWYLYAVETAPGTTAPTEGYTITITDASGLDLAGGKVIGSHTVAASAFCFPAGGSFLFVSGPLTFTVAGNLVASGNGTAILYFVPR